MSSRTMSSLNPSALQRQPTGNQPTGTQHMGNCTPTREHTPYFPYGTAFFGTRSASLAQRHGFQEPEPMTLGDLMRAAAKKSRLLSSPKSRSPLRKVVLQNQMVQVVNAALVGTPQSTEIVTLDCRFINQAADNQRDNKLDNQRDNQQDNQLDNQQDNQLDNQLDNQQSEHEVPTEEWASEFSSASSSEVPTEEWASEFSSASSSEFSIVGDDGIHTEFPDDGAYLLPTQHGFDMSAPSQSLAEYNFDDIAMLNPEDEQAFTEQLEDPTFEVYLTAVIHASGLVHAMQGTIPSMDEFFALHALINRACSNTATDLDQAQIAYLLSLLADGTTEDKCARRN